MNFKQLVEINCDVVVAREALGRVSQTSIGIFLSQLVVVAQNRRPAVASCVKCKMVVVAHYITYLPNYLTAIICKNLICRVITILCVCVCVCL